MYINFLQDRKALGYETCEDIQCGIKLVKISDRVFIAIKTLPCKVGEGKQTIKKTFAILAFGVLIFFVDPKPAKAIGTTMIPTQIERLSKANSYREIKPSVIVINVNYEKPPKIVLVRMKSDVTNTKWIDDFIVSIRGGSEEDAKLIRSILYKLGESNLDVASINKILARLGNIVGSIVSNQDLLRLLSELEKPFNPELVKVSPPLSNDILGFAKNVEAKQHKSKSSSSVFADAFTMPISGLSPHQQRELLKSKPESPRLFSTEVYANHDQNYNAPREINENFATRAVERLAKKSLTNQDVKNEYNRIKKRLGEGIHPMDINKKSVAVGDNKVLIKGAEGRYVVEVSDTHVDILGMSYRGDKKNIKTFQNLMNDIYGLNLQY